ncbi:hypothetical protein [Cumulibacter soli]|uniref:hypothetical protein n=1 Tax=Cumulibacter soli TaxID=2546344 RepID=UPI001068D0C0|nr:hypothetical protein [Cumulibacter soli]
MNTAGRLTLFGAGLAVAFGAAFGIASVAVPDSVVTAWAEDGEADAHGGGHGDGAHDASAPNATGHAINGVSTSAEGYLLSAIQAPDSTGSEGQLSFQIRGEDGQPVTQFATAHEKELHLIVVRNDGALFQHVHPVMDSSTGTWSIPWTWQEPGTYRVYADFTPAAPDAETLTLTRTVEVAGNVAPVEKGPQRVDEVDGYTVTVAGDLTADGSSELTFTIEQDGQPVTTLQPYLGAFGHLVALREGDLAYLHVHALGNEPQSGENAAAEIGFAAQAPSAGRYFLYLDFQIDGEVHTAEFVLDAEL